MSNNVIPFAPRTRPANNRPRVHVRGLDPHDAKEQGYLQPVPRLTDAEADYALERASSNVETDDLLNTVRQLMASLAEAEAELSLAETQRDEALKGSATMARELDRVVEERDHLVRAHQESLADASEGDLEVETFRCALGDMTIALKETNATVRRLHASLNDVHDRVFEIAQSTWAYPVRDQLLAIVESQK